MNFEDRIVEITQSENQKEEKVAFKWENFKGSPGKHQAYQYSHYKGSGEGRHKGTENLFKGIIAENYSNLEMLRDCETKTQIDQEQDTLWLRQQNLA